MRFDHDGIVSKYGTAESPTPSGSVRSSAGNQSGVTVTIAVQPPSVSDRVQLLLA